MFAFDFEKNRQKFARGVPAVLLGGGRNALSVARSLGLQGVEVHVICVPHDPVRYSKHVKWIDVPDRGNPEGAWAEYLLGPESDWLQGRVLLCMSDAGLMVLSQNREALEKKFILDLSNPEAQLKMLYKLSTYEIATAAGVPTPKYWVPESVAELATLRHELVFPLIVKPLLSHEFEARFNKMKYLRAENHGEVLDAFRQVTDAGVRAMLVEYLPGGDDHLCSYYTYMDERGEALFDFTKRIIRRYPAGMGLACCHITDWNPEVRALALKLFQAAGLRGLANAEFKRDPRDGRLKLMECNGRFTAATNLVTASGIDLGLFVYRRLAGGPPVPTANYVRGLVLWDLQRDFKAFREAKDLTIWSWLRSIRWPFVPSVFSWRDPGPTLFIARVGLQKLFGRITPRFRKAQPA